MHYNIVVDTDPMSPREDCNLGKILYTSSRYILGDEQVSPDKINNIMNSEDYIYLPVYAYIHGGVALNTTGFSCPWDSGMSGIIYMSKDDIRSQFNKKRISPKLYNQVLDILRGEIDIYNKYLNGDVYGYEIVNDNGDIVDSCYGYYGSEEAEIAAKDAITWYKNQAA